MPKQIYAKLKEYLTPTTVSIIGAALLLLVFVQLARGVTDGETLAIDRSLLELVNSTASASLDQFFVTATTMGGVYAVAVIAAGAVALLLGRRKFRDAAIIVGTLAGTALTVYSLKIIFARPRPSLWQTLVTEGTYSFPSGHTIASSALALSLIVVLWSSRWRWLAVTIGVAYMLVIGYSRLYLGVHYPTDVVGSWLLSAAWVIVVYQLVSAVEARARV